VLVPYGLSLDRALSSNRRSIESVLWGDRLPLNYLGVHLIDKIYLIILFLNRG